MTWADFIRRFLPHLAARSYDVANALITAALAQPLSRQQRRLIAPFIGGRDVPTAAVAELVLIFGRGSAKTQTAAALLIYLALSRQWPTSPGQVPMALLLCASTDQSSIAFRFVLGLLQSNATLWAEVASVTKQSISLTNGVLIEIAAADFRTVRGYSLICAICDELAHWPTSATSANPDSETMAAVRPGLARLKGSMLVAISTPYARQGELFEYHRRYFGQSDARVLVAHGATADVNPTFDRKTIADAYARDPASASAEYGAQFRSDRAAFIDVELVDANTRSEPRELPYRAGTASGTPIVYWAGLDASGGRQDATAVAIAHDEDGHIVIDLVRRWPAPHDPAKVAGEVATLLKSFRLVNAASDAYAAGFSRSTYSAVGIGLTDAPGTRSDAYLHLLPLLTQGRIELPPDPTLRTEMLTLERRVGRSGKDTVDHRVGGHDDASNAVALAAWMGSRQRGGADGQVLYSTSTINSGLEGFGAGPDGGMPLESGFDRMFNNW